MTDSITYFGDPVRATCANGDLIIVNGRPLLIPPNFKLQNEINAALFKAGKGVGALSDWLLGHYALGSSGDPQRQAGHWGGFDPRYTDAGNYAFGLSAAAAGLSLEGALAMAMALNRAGAHKALPSVNENAIRQGFGDYGANRFQNGDDVAGEAYTKSVAWGDRWNAIKTGADFFIPSTQITESDVDRCAKAHLGDLNSLEALAFKRNFQQAFGSYPQHLDIDLLSPSDGSARYLSTRIVDASGSSLPDGGVPVVQRNNVFSPDDQGSLGNPILRYIQAAPNVPPATTPAFDIPGSYFGRLLTGTAHLVPDGR